MEYIVLKHNLKFIKSKVNELVEKKENTISLKEEQNELGDKSKI